MSSNDSRPRRPVAKVISTVGAVVGPIQAFFRLQAASGIVLFGAAVVALVWANSTAHRSYEELVTTRLVVDLGPLDFGITLHQVVNDVLMTIFFFVVGMEIKRELVSGELSTVRRAMLPALAALGGMLVPAGIFLALNLGGPGQSGWGIPMATDIAFAIGCLTLLGRRVPQALTVFLLAIAIFDDIGGIVVIALFYGQGLDLPWLLAAGLATAVLFAMNRAYVRSGFAYAIVGASLWYALHHGGVHATISGVVLGLMIPSRPRPVVREGEPGPAEPAPLERFIHNLHPCVAFVIMPVFALTNSGVYVGGMAGSDLVGPVALGTGLGLALGKPIGIVGATVLAVKLGLADRPAGTGWLPLLGVGIIAGIGFTVAIFIATLAYPETTPLLAQAKVGIVLGSLVSGLIGVTIVRLTLPLPPAPRPPGSPGRTPERSRVS
jgi:NhaA family Na+:H+ antiporter